MEQDHLLTLLNITVLLLQVPLLICEDLIQSFLFEFPVAFLNQ